MDLKDLIPERNILFEEAIQRDPDNESLWLDYVQANEGDLQRLEFILERAVATLPASHNLWNSYLLLLWTDKHLDKLKLLYKRALLTLRDTPALWLRYLKLMKDEDVELYSQALDLALFNLDHSHHKAIWQDYLELANSIYGTVGISVYVRLFEMQDYEICPLVIDRCECVLQIAEFGDISKAIDLLIQIPRGSLKTAEDDTAFMSLILDILILSEFFNNGPQFERLALDAALDSPHKESKFLLKIARFYDKRSNMQNARHFYSRSMKLANSLRSLAESFEKYTNFLEKELLILVDERKIEDIKPRLELLQELIENQPIIVSDILLKSEPNNIDIWLERIQIYKDRGKTNEVISTLISAIKGINPLEAKSTKGTSLAKIWSEYANLYINLGDTKTANLIYSRAVKSQYINPQDLALIYIMWCELLLMDSDEEALDLIEEVLLAIPKNADEIAYDNRKLSVQERIFKSTMLWEFYIDLLQSMGEGEVYALKLLNAYETMISLKVITLRNLFQYTDTMIDVGNFQKCYSVFEKAIHSFETPTPKFQIWNVYLTTLIKKEQDTNKVEDAFERCIASDLPGHLAASIFEMYSKFVKESGSLTRSVKIQLEAIEYLSKAYRTSKGENAQKIVDEKFRLYNDVFKVVSCQFKDVDGARQTISSAIKDTDLSLSMIFLLTKNFADYELEIREISRARALYKHAASLTHPDSNVVKVIWQQWAQFEVDFGTEATYNDMIKFKKVVTKEFEAISDFKSEINPMGFVKGESTQKHARVSVTKDPNEIDLDMDM